MNAAKDRRTSEEPKLDAAPFDIDWALNRLRADQRQAILLRFFEDRSFVEIARELRMTEEAARKRVSRALERLRDLLGAKATAGTGLSAGLVEEVLRRSVFHAPGALTASAAHAATTATTAAGAGPAAASATSLAKGALTLMALSNAKIATGIILAAVLLLGGGAVAWKAAELNVTRAVIDRRASCDGFGTAASHRIIWCGREARNVFYSRNRQAGRNRCGDKGESWVVAQVQGGYLET